MDNLLKIAKFLYESKSVPCEDTHWCKFDKKIFERVMPVKGKIKIDNNDT